MPARAFSRRPGAAHVSAHNSSSARRLVRHLPVHVDRGSRSPDAHAVPAGPAQYLLLPPAQRSRLMPLHRRSTGRKCRTTPPGRIYRGDVRDRPPGKFPGRRVRRFHFAAYQDYCPLAPRSFTSHGGPAAVLIAVERRLPSENRGASSQSVRAKRFLCARRPPLPRASPGAHCWPSNGDRAARCASS